MLDLEKVKCEFCEKKMEWIPCSERLPEEKDGAVLVTLVTGEIKTASHSEHSRAWFIGDMAAGCHADYVIAWMPLPEAYDEEGNKSC